MVPSTPILVDIGVDFWSDAVQPTNDGQAAGMYIDTSFCLDIRGRRLTIPGRKFEDKVGPGEPTENPYDGRDRN
jgi:hypothetical protein